jgi:hypothetical protein
MDHNPSSTKEEQRRDVTPESSGLAAAKKAMHGGLLKNSEEYIRRSEIGNRTQIKREIESNTVHAVSTGTF